MKPKITYVEPAVMLSVAEKEMDAIPSEQLFNDSQYQKLKERWCAGMFGLGYSTAVSPCVVAVNEAPDRMDVDIYLRSANRDWEFQLAEAQDPDRKRGLEYKQLATGAVKTIGYRPERGKLEGPIWLANGVQRKKDKNYSNSSMMNLLLYANFTANKIDHSTLVQQLSSFSTDFASLWILTNLCFCSIFSFTALGQTGGWSTIRPIEHYYT